MDPMEFSANMSLLIVGAVDTTRNTMSGLAYGLNKFPDQRAKLEADPSLIPDAVSEIIRWQTPLAHMRRTALVDTELEGHKIKVGVNPDLLEMMERTIPLGRGGTPEEAAGSVYLLCIPESNYVSGQTLICGGGISI